MPARTVRVDAAARDRIVAAAVKSGRIHPGRARWWRGRLDAGSPADRGRAVAELLSHWPAGHPLVQAASQDADVWNQLYGPWLKEPAAKDSDQARKLGAMTAAEYRRLYPEPGDYDPSAFPPPIPELAMVQPAPKLTAPDAGNQTAAAVAASGSRPGLDRPVIWAGGPVHGPVTAWHQHAHVHDGVSHSHEHVHQDSGSHDPGPGHAHHAVPEQVDYGGDGGDPPGTGLAVPDGGMPAMPMFNARQARRRVRAAVAASAASPRRVVPWP